MLSGRAKIWSLYQIANRRGSSLKELKQKADAGKRADKLRQMLDADDPEAFQNAHGRAFKSFLAALTSFIKRRDLSEEYLSDKFEIEQGQLHPTSSTVVLQIVNPQYDQKDPAAYIRGAKKSMLS